MDMFRFSKTGVDVTNRNKTARNFTQKFYN